MQSLSLDVSELYRKLLFPRDVLRTKIPIYSDLLKILIYVNSICNRTPNNKIIA